MARKPIPTLSLLILIPVIFGMGGNGADSTSIPKPEELYTAKLMDRNGVETVVEQFSCDGRVFLSVERGGGTLMVPFSKISAVNLGQQAGSKIAAEIKIAGDQELKGEISRSMKCAGSTPFGNFIAEIVNIDSMELVPQR